MSKHQFELEKFSNQFQVQQNVASALGQDSDHDSISISSTQNFNNLRQSLKNKDTQLPSSHIVQSEFHQIQISPQDDQQGLLNQTSKAQNITKCDRETCCHGVIWSTVAIIVIVAITALFFPNVSSYVQSLTKQQVPIRSVILMVSDGFGPSSQVFARSFYTEFLRSINSTITSNLDPFEVVDLPLDDILVGSVQTHSFDSYVTDSAAAATAYSCGIKTNNHVIGMNASNKACASIMEAAHAQGYRTGLVVTTRITHATPAAFYSHVPSRSQEDEIAKQLVNGFSNVNQSVDLIFGGGLCHFIPKSQQSSCRKDDTDLISQMKASYWDIGYNRSSFDNLQLNDSLRYPIIRLFSSDHMSFEIDRQQQQEPSLAEMTLKALSIFDFDILKRSQQKNFNGNGFFLLVEGSRIDMAAHANDPVGHVHDILAYQEAVLVAQQYVDTHPGTILISVSDHETGGLSVAYQGGQSPAYEFRPDLLLNVKQSTEKITLLYAQKYLNIAQNNSIIKKDLEVAQLIYSLLQYDLKLVPSPWINETSLRSKSGYWVDFMNDAQWNLSKYYPGRKPPPYFFTYNDIQKIVSLTPSVTQLFAEFQSTSPQNPDLDSNDYVFNPSELPSSLLPLQYYFGELLSRNSEIGWTTKGHSGADVNLYVYGLDQPYLSQSFDPAQYFSGNKSTDNNATQNQKDNNLIKRDWSIKSWFNYLFGSKQQNHTYMFPLLNTSFKVPTSSQQLDNQTWWLKQAKSNLSTWPGKPIKSSEYPDLSDDLAMCVFRRVQIQLISVLTVSFKTNNVQQYYFFLLNIDFDMNLKLYLICLGAVLSLPQDGPVYYSADQITEVMNITSNIITTTTQQITEIVTSSLPLTTSQVISTTVPVNVTTRPINTTTSEILTTTTSINLTTTTTSTAPINTTTSIPVTTTQNQTTVPVTTTTINITSTETITSSANFTTTATPTTITITSVVTTTGTVSSTLTTTGTTTTVIVTSGPITTQVITTSATVLIPTTVFTSTFIGGVIQTLPKSTEVITTTPFVTSSVVFSTSTQSSGVETTGTQISVIPTSGTTTQIIPTSTVINVPTTIPVGQPISIFEISASTTVIMPGKTATIICTTFFPIDCVEPTVMPQ